MQEKGYSDLDAFVALSGTVPLSVHEGDTGEKYTEPELNGVSEAALKKEFRESATHRFLTLSRLNRRAPGKRDTFVLDFVNDAEEIRRSFQPYYQGTTALEGADHTHLYRLRGEPLAMEVIHESDVDAFARDFYVPGKKRTKKAHGKWQRWMQPAVDRFGGWPSRRRSSSAGSSART